MLKNIVATVEPRAPRAHAIHGGWVWEKSQFHSTFSTK
jgi:hypothetical protein